MNGSTTYDDREERDALLDGALALRYRADRLRDVASREEEFAKSVEFRTNAAILEEMADCYEVDDDASA